jgi:hypothetical protein
VVTPLLRRSIRPEAGIFVTTIDELCIGFNWISMLEYMRPFRLHRHRRRRQFHQRHCATTPTTTSPSRLVTGEGFSCGDGDDQSLSFFKMLGRFMGGEASVTLAQLRFARICNQIHCDYDWRNHKQQEQIPDNFGSIFRR